MDDTGSTMLQRYECVQSPCTDGGNRLGGVYYNSMALFQRAKQISPDPLSAASLVAHASPKKKRGAPSRAKIVVGLLFILTLAVLLWVGYQFGYQYWQLKEKAQALPLSGEVRDAMVLARLQGEVNRLIMSPQETPQVLVLTGVSDLATKNKFFAQAQDGDVLFAYPQALQAYIYRPSTRVLVNVGPIVPQQAKPETRVVPQPVSLEVRNGTGLPGESKKFIEKLGASSDFSKVTANDARSRFSRAVIVSKQKSIPQLERLISLLGSDSDMVDVVPTGEDPAVADITVFLGKQ